MFISVPFCLLRSSSITNYNKKSVFRVFTFQWINGLTGMLFTRMWSNFRKKEYFNPSFIFIHKQNISLLPQWCIVPYPLGQNVFLHSPLTTFPLTKEKRQKFSHTNNNNNATLGVRDRLKILWIQANKITIIIHVYMYFCAQNIALNFISLCGKLQKLHHVKGRCLENCIYTQNVYLVSRGGNWRSTQGVFGWVSRVTSLGVDWAWVEWGWLSWWCYWKDRRAKEWQECI